MRSFIWSPEENVYLYYKEHLLGNLVKLLKATDNFVIDEKKWENFDKFTQQLDLYSHFDYSKFLYDMTDFIDNPEASHPIFGELYNNFKDKLKLLYLEIIKKQIENIDFIIDENLKKFLDPNNKNKKFYESEEFIAASSTCKNFLALDFKNVKIDPNLKEFIYSNNHHILTLLMKSQALTIYKNCLELDQTNIDAEIEHINSLINGNSDTLIREKFLIKKVILENVSNNFLNLLPVFFNPNNQLLHTISLMIYFEAILTNFKNVYPHIEKIGQKHHLLGKKYRKFFRVTEDEKLRNNDKIIHDDEVEKLGRDLIITALVRALVNINDISHRETFIERVRTMEHKNPKIYHNLDINLLADKLQKIITFYQYSTIEQQILTIQLKIEGMEAKGIGALEEASVKVAANLTKQLLELKTEAKIIPLMESNTEFKTAPTSRSEHSKRQKKRSANLNPIKRATSQFIPDKVIPIENESKYKPSREKEPPTSRNVFPSPLLKSTSNFDGEYPKFPFWKENKSPITIITEPSHREKNKSPITIGESSNRMKNKSTTYQERNKSSIMISESSNREKDKSTITINAPSQKKSSAANK